MKTIRTDENNFAHSLYTLFKGHTVFCFKIKEGDEIANILKG